MATLLSAQGRDRADLADLAGARRDFEAASKLRQRADWNWQAETAFLVAAAQVQTADRLSDRYQWAAAIDLLQRAIALDPKNERAYRALSWAYIESDQQDKAIEVMRKILETHPTSSNLRALADGFEWKEDYAQAIELLTKATLLDQDDRRTHEQLGRVLREDGQIDRAIAELGRAIEISPTKSAYVEMARAYRMRRQFQQALENIGKAKELDSQYAYAYAQAGLLYEEDLHDFAAAYNELKTATSLSPDYAADFAEACLVSGHWNEALHTAEELLTSSRNSEELAAHKRLALSFISVAALLLQGKREEAQTVRLQLDAYMKTLSKFDQGWNYSVTRKYLALQPMKGADRTMLLGLLDKIERPPHASAHSR